MKTKNIVRQLLYMFLPAILFKVVHSRFGVLTAIAVSLALSAVMLALHFKKHHRMSNSLIIGLGATILSFVGVVFTDNERFYFVPAILQNCVFIFIILGFMIRRKCYVHWFVRDLHIPYLNEMDETEFLSINIIWLAIFVIRVSIKIISLLSRRLSFDSLYWISFLSGDPVTLPVIVYTYFYFKKRIDSYYLVTYAAKKQ